MSYEQTTNAKYLESYFDLLEMLPLNIRRHMNLLRVLDEKYNSKLAWLDKEVAKIRRKKKCYRTEKIQKIRATFKVLYSYADQKVDLANDAYDMVDKFIQQLDTHLCSFKEDIVVAVMPTPENLLTTEHQNGDTQENHFISVLQLSANLEKAVKKTHQELNQKTTDELCHRLKRKMRFSSNISSIDGSATSVLDSPKLESTVFSSNIFENEPVLNMMPVDPNEPTYCYCQRVSFGNMVACDNTQCDIEWFHFECVGLMEKPKSNWYCSICRL